MYVPFEQLPPHSRVWIYQSAAELREDKLAVVRETLRSFCDQWEVHGMPLTTSFCVRYDHFIVLGVDEQQSQASGCSIDSSVHVMKQAGALLGVDLFDRTQVAFLRSGEMVFLGIAQLKKAFAEGIINPSTPAFNNLVDTKYALDTKWLVPAAESWLKRYIPQVSNPVND
ncbi:MAG: hypothetical protein K1X47_13845 [Cyclobacteriaceae bacterium]|nr:hypothetical protein [Cyclobacteriaceae bacterium]